LRQRNPHARVVRLRVAARALLARLSPPLQPAGDAPVQLRARPPAGAPGGVGRGGLPARVLLEGRGVRDAASQPRDVSRTDTADPGRSPGGAHQGNADETDRRVRPEAGREICGEAAADRVGYAGRQGGRGRAVRASTPAVLATALAALA